VNPRSQDAETAIIPLLSRGRTGAEDISTDTIRVRPVGNRPNGSWLVSERDLPDEGESAGDGGEAGEPAHKRWSRLRTILSYLPLGLVLGGQGYLTYRLIPSNTAFLDEATYLYSGHQELAHILHGVKIPEYQTFFSGAPVLYPVLAAIADHFGGLIGARLLSMAFMLLSTLALYLTARRMYGGRAAFFAAAQFAALGPTQFLGAYATYDSMSLCLMAWAAFCAVKFAYGDHRNYLLLGAVSMALADCTKYACLLWNPVVIGLAGLVGRNLVSWKLPRWWNAQRFFVLWATVMVLFVLVGRHLYFQGFVQTTLVRQGGTDSAKYLATSAADWIGSVMAIALLSVIVALVSHLRGKLSRSEFLLIALLFVGGLLAPANQIRIHTWLSLQKHVDFGVWFSCIAAGVLLAKLCGSLKMPAFVRSVATLVVAALAIAPIGYVGMHQAKYLFSAWPDSSALISTLRPYVHRGPEQYLVEDYDVPAYYLIGQSEWQQWHDLEVGTYTDPVTHVKLSGVPAFEAAILAHKYSVIVLDFAETPATDNAVRPTITEAGYRLIARIPTQNSKSHGDYYVWILPNS